ncbi:MAG TPA: VOC family protein [Haliangiales bacterium]|nr:VOC family protein [Haliangiales bacterium]
MASLLVNIDVDDLPRAVDFYVRAFDLRVGRRFGDGAVELLDAEAPIYLLAKPAGSPPFAGAAAGRDYARHWTPVHLDFVVDDLDAAIYRAEAAGAVREAGISTQPWGRIAIFRDPFGHGFCLLAFTGRGYDEIATP